MRLILFDIDGTLIDSGEAGTRSLNLAFAEVFSIRHAFEGISMAGKTDVQIIKDALRKLGIAPDSEAIAAVIKSYIGHLKTEIQNDRKHIKPGINNVLDRLAEKRDCTVGLLTGNIEEGARIKLDSFGLTKYFTLDNCTAEPRLKGGCAPFGAFGSDSEDRTKLLPVAVARFKSFSGKAVGYCDCVVVGDTPLDIQCARPYGAFVIAVATGPYSTEHLRLAGADSVMVNLSDAEEFMGYIGGQLPSF